jgi:hypothetical protein
MKSNWIFVAAVLVGAACGLASLSPWLAGQWANLIVWAVAGVALGLLAAGRRMIVGAGIVYGVCLSLTFLLGGFRGSPDKLPGLVVLTLALSVIGAIGGIVTVWAGSWLRGRVKPI